MLHRKLGLEFVRDMPTVWLVFSRQVLEPLRLLQAAKFETTPRDYEAQQRDLERRAMDTDNVGEARTYRVLVSASNIDENAALHTLRLLYENTDLWSLISDPELAEWATARWLWGGGASSAWCAAWRIVCVVWAGVCGVLGGRAGCRTG